MGLTERDAILKRLLELGVVLTTKEQDSLLKLGVIAVFKEKDCVFHINHIGDTDREDTSCYKSGVEDLKLI